MLGRGLNHCEGVVQHFEQTARLYVVRIRFAESQKPSHQRLGDGQLIVGVLEHRACGKRAGTTGILKKFECEASGMNSVAKLVSYAPCELCVEAGPLGAMHEGSRPSRTSRRGIRA